MLLFKRSKPNATKIQAKLHVAQESREPYFDLSECQLKKLPKGVESQIKYFNKKILILHTNQLTRLCNTGTASDLSGLTHLDLHSNRFKIFPQEIYGMLQLQVLDLSGNELEYLPNELSHLACMKVLNVKDNLIKQVPSVLGKLKKLEKLHLDGNPITKLPIELGTLKQLKFLEVSSESMLFPPPDICSKGTTMVISYLRKAGNLPEDGICGGSTSPDCDFNELSFDELQGTECRNQFIDQRMELFQHVTNELSAQGEMARQLAQSRLNTVEKLGQEDVLLKSQLEQLQKQREERRLEFVSSVREALDHADYVIKYLKLRPPIHVEEHDMLPLDKRAYTSLSKDDRQKILDSMKAMLASSEASLLLYRGAKEKHMFSTSGTSSDFNPALWNVLDLRQADQVKLASRVATEEIEQVKAFECLQRQRDRQRQRIVDDIRLVEAELCRLTQTEKERRAAQGASAASYFSERRRDLVRFWAELQRQKALRESQLRRRLNTPNKMLLLHQEELEEQRTHDQTDYWLVQFQRLIARKPEVLKREGLLEDDVYSILALSGAHDYVANFEYGRITLDMLHSFTNNDLIRVIGVTSADARRRILQAIANYHKQRSLLLEPSAPTEEEKEEAAMVNEVKLPGSTTAGGVSLPETEASAPPANIVAHFEDECCICQNSKCSIIFIPCGHVCCCGLCSDKVTQCPLCRVNVAQRVQIS